VIGIPRGSKTPADSLDGSLAGCSGRLDPPLDATWFETQYFSNLPDEPSFRAEVVRAGPELTSTTTYAFSAD
jgi:hypothetical protein